MDIKGTTADIIAFEVFVLMIPSTRLLPCPRDLIRMDKGITFAMRLFVSSSYGLDAAVESFIVGLFILACFPCLKWISASCFSYKILWQMLNEVTFPLLSLRKRLLATLSSCYCSIAGIMMRRIRQVCRIGGKLVSSHFLRKVNSNDKWAVWRTKHSVG